MRIISDSIMRTINVFKCNMLKITIITSIGSTHYYYAIAIAFRYLYFEYSVSNAVLFNIYTS